MPLYTPLSGSWLNLAEALQRIIVRRALSGQHPQTPEEIITWLEETVSAWDDDPTPFVWGGKRKARRERARQRRLGGSPALPADHHSNAARPTRRTGTAAADEASGSTYACAHWDLDRAPESIARVGLTGVEVLTHGLGRPDGQGGREVNDRLRPEWPEERIAAPEEQLGRLGLRPVCLSPATGYRQPYHGSVRADVDKVCRRADPAARLGAPGAALRRQRPPGRLDGETAIGQIGEALRECGRCAQSEGVRELVRTPALRAVALSASVGTFSGGVWATVLVLFLARELGLAYACGDGGALLGAAVAAHVGHSRPDTVRRCSQPDEAALERAAAVLGAG